MWSGGLLSHSSIFMECPDCSLIFTWLCTNTIYPKGTIGTGGITRRNVFGWPELHSVRSTTKLQRPSGAPTSSLILTSGGRLWKSFSWSTTSWRRGPSFQHSTLISLALSSSCSPLRFHWSSLVLYQYQSGRERVGFDWMCVFMCDHCSKYTCLCQLVLHFLFSYGGAINLQSYILILYRGCLAYAIIKLWDQIKANSSHFRAIPKFPSEGLGLFSSRIFVR